MQPDGWVSDEYKREFGPKGQWLALRRLFHGEPLSDENINWLRQTSVSDVDGKMAEVLLEWKKEGGNALATFKNDPKSRAEDLVDSLEQEIEAIKSGTLTETKAREVAKFRGMQLNTIRFVLDAARLIKDGKP